MSQIDKVMQSNAASAEESAASAQELNAQALAVKQSVADLLQLFGHPNQAAEAKAQYPAHYARNVRPATLVNNARSVDGNGHSQPILKATRSGRNSNPGPGDFNGF